MMKLVLKERYKNDNGYSNKKHKQKNRELNPNTSSNVLQEQ